MTRRYLTAGLGVLIAVVTAAFLVYTPPRGRLSAVPAYAQVIYNSESPDSLFSVFPTLGKMNRDFSNHWNPFFQTLENHPLAVASVAFPGAGNRPAWVAVSELSAAQAMALRWRLMLFAPDDVRAAPSYMVWPVWRLESSSLPVWATVRFVITERLLICCISTDSRDIYRLLNVADGRAASMAGSVVE